jgi:uncharacterized protein YdhG (YjbR/CyaY superfamily)
MMSKNNAVDGVIRALPLDRKEALETIRGFILDTIPDIEETMRYNMPTYEKDEVACALASQKHYISLYMDVDLVEGHREKLKHLDVGKSCIRFKKIDDLPFDIVKEILEETVVRQSKIG